MFDLSRTSSFLTVLLSSSALAQVTTDGSVGRIVTLSGSEIVVDEVLGTRRGDNLFHSFGSFDVQRRGRVEFAGDNGLKHILARVTGDGSSSIDGTIASSAGNANLWIINPNGIRFGSHAALDVGGSFHAGTASEIRFGDGAVFSVNPDSASTLSVAEPQAFGFGGGQPQPIHVDGSNFTLAPEQQLTLTAGDLRITGDGVEETIRIEGGRLYLVGAGVGDEVRPTANERAPVGSVAIAESAAINLSGNGGGTLEIDAATTEIQGASRIDLRNTGMNDADVVLNLRSQRLLVSDNTEIVASALDAGSAGSASLAGDEITIEDGSFIDAGSLTVTGGDIVIDGGDNAGRTGLFSSVSYGVSNAGDVMINGSSIQLLRGGQISSSSVYGGDAGRIVVDATQFLIDGVGIINTGLLTESDYGGYGGSIEVSAVDTITLLNAGLIRSSTTGYYAAGDITLSASAFEIDGRGSDQLTGVFSTTSGYGQAGNVQLSGDRLAITGGAQVSSDTLAGGDAGRIEVFSNDLIINGSGPPDRSAVTRISSRSGVGATGAAGDISIESRGLVELQAGGQIISSAERSTYAGYGGRAGAISVIGAEVILDGGDDSSRTGLFSEVNYRSAAAGEVLVRSDSLIVQRGAQINSSSNYGGDAGQIDVDVGQLIVDGDGFVSTGILTTSQYGGYGGQIDVTATTEVALFEGGLISSSTGGYYAAGNIAVSSPSIDIDGRGGDQLTGVFSNSTGYGRAGGISVSSDHLEIAGGGRMATDAFAAGDAGNIVVNADKLTIIGLGPYASSLTGLSSRSAVGATGQAGQISINSSEVLVEQGALVSTQTNGPGDAGSIMITTDQLSLFDGGLLRSSSQGSGAAGNILLDTVRIDFTDAAVRTAGRNAEGGRIRVNATELVSLRDVEITTNGIVPGDGASIIEVDAPILAINRSNIFSLIEEIELTPQSLELFDQISSGEANLLGGTSIVSIDTIVAATTNVDVTGVLNDIDSNLQLNVPSLVNATNLLNQACFANRDDTLSSMTVDRIESLSTNPTNALGVMGKSSKLGDAC